ncbi:hypothetical protein ADILRU_0334 [Leifsonia rubra CMS 76R]|nr:hypothetical protein ADILRU_0334 [Leifsonia rubra CMS 76R]
MGSQFLSFAHSDDRAPHPASMGNDGLSPAHGNASVAKPVAMMMARSR